jgi:MFS family permease
VTSTAPARAAPDDQAPAAGEAGPPAGTVDAPRVAGEAPFAPGPGGAEEVPLHLAPAVAAPAIPDAPLRGNRDFWVVLVGQGVSSFGDAITNTALPLLVLALTGSGLAMGVVGVLSTLPDLVIGLPAGAYADRWDRRKMMFLADLGRAGLTALIPISVWLDGPTLALIMLVTFPLNVLRVVWLAAFTAAVPGLVGRGQIPRANAIFEAFFNVGWIVGPALAGFLAATIGPGPTIALDALTFALSAGALLLVRRPLKPEARTEPSHLVADIREGIAFVVRHPTLRAVIALWTTSSVVFAGLTSALIFYITIDRGDGSGVVGVVLSAFAVGSLGGSLVAARMAFHAVGPVMLVGITGIGVALVVVALDVPVAVLVAGAFVAGILNANVLVSYLTLRTQLSPDALLGRVGATARTLSVGMMPIGALVAGALLDVIGGTATLVLMGAASIAAGAGFALLPTVRHARVPRSGARP